MSQQILALQTLKSKAEVLACFDKLLKSYSDLLTTLSQYPAFRAAVKEGVSKKFGSPLIAMKKIILILCLIACYSCVFSQNKNSIYLEAAGNGIVYTINYDRIINLTEKIKLAPRIGFEYFPQNKNSDYTGIILPLELNGLFAKRKLSKNFAEAGFGLNLVGIKEVYTINADGSIDNYNNKVANVCTLRVGFRHQKPTGGFMYRAGLLIPFSQDDFSKSIVGDDIFYRIYGGISLGYSF